MYTAALFVLFVLLLFWYTRKSDDAYLYGYWFAEHDAFCDSSQIDAMMLFIGEPTRDCRQIIRQGHIIITPDMTDQGFTMEYTPGWSGGNEIIAQVQFDEEQIWGGEPVTFTVNVNRGTLVIRGVETDTLYARLTKNHEITNLLADA